MRINHVDCDTLSFSTNQSLVERSGEKRRLVCYYYPFHIASKSTAATMKVVLPKSATMEASASSSASPWKYSMKSTTQTLSMDSDNTDATGSATTATATTNRDKPSPLRDATPNKMPIMMPTVHELIPLGTTTDKAFATTNFIASVDVPTVLAGATATTTTNEASTAIKANLSTSMVDLDVSIADTEMTGDDGVDVASTSTIARFTNVVETAMANFRQHDKDSSCLSKVWLACDENQHISMQDALEAAVTDMMNLQSQLVVAERKIEDFEAMMAGGAGATTKPASTNSQKQQADNGSDNNQVQQHSSKEAALLARIAELERELSKSKASVDQHANSKQRMIANLKKKKTEMQVTEHELSVATLDLKHLSAENAKLRQELQSATEARDSFKNKLRSQQESVKESRACIQDLEKRLRKTEMARALECELLDNFRKLAIHTGYYRWGKPIRALEDKIAAFAAADEAFSAAEQSI